MHQISDFVLMPCNGLIRKPYGFMIDQNMKMRSNAIEGAATHKKGILYKKHVITNFQRRKNTFQKE